jgi:type I restriction enzyme S subunit
LENPPSVAEDGQGLEEDFGEDRGMSEVVPNGWSTVEFESFATLQRGKDLTRAQFREGPVPVAGSNGVIGYHDTAIAKAPGITVGRSGSAGKVTVYEEDFWPHNTSLYVRDFHGNDPHFAGYLLGSLDLSRFKTGASVPTLDRNSFKTLPILVPPLPEQKKIAHILSTVQRAIEAQERIIQITTELKKALMHKLFTEGLRNEPQKETEIGLVPKSWEVVPLSDVCRFQSGGTPSKKNPEFWEGTIPWVSPKDMKRPRLDDVTDHITQEALDSGSKLAPAGSVFVVVRGMILAKTIPVALAEVPMAINQDMKAIVPGLKLCSDFLLYALETLRDNLFKKVGRSGHGTCTLMSHEIAGFKIPLPELETQEAVAAAIQNLERKKELHEEKRTQLQDLFRTLLHELMTAKTRVDQVDLPLYVKGEQDA